MSKEVLTPESPRWEQFIEKLNSYLALDGCAGDASEDTHCHAKFIMRAKRSIGMR